jgi:hypothetical protein
MPREGAGEGAWDGLGVRVREGTVPGQGRGWWAGGGGCSEETVKVGTGAVAGVAAVVCGGR